MKNVGTKSGNGSKGTRAPRTASPLFAGKPSRISVFVASSTVALSASLSAQGAVTTLTFDDLPGEQNVTTQYQGKGVTITGATVANANVYLIPPKSAPNVAYAPTGLIRLSFNVTGVKTVSAYITGPGVGIYAYDAGNNLLGASQTQGTGYNEFLTVTSASGPIAKVEIHDGGSSFYVDDFSFDTGLTNYSVTDLSLGGTVGGTTPQGMNAIGQVAGFGTTSKFAIHAFAYLGNSVQDIGTLGGPYSIANAVNAGGRVVGAAQNARNQIHAFSWTASSGMSDLGTLGGTSSEAVSVNSVGQVTGSSATRSGQRHAFLWASGGMSDLGTLGGQDSSATTVNSTGRVAGTSQTRNQKTHAFSWTPSEGMVDIGTLGGASSAAAAVNAQGQIVGVSQLKNGQVHGFAWMPGSGMADVGTLGGRASAAAANNDAGQVVGSAQLANGDLHAFSWTAVTGLKDIGTLGGRTSSALAVNNAGQVVGTAQAANGELRAFLWNAGTMTDLNTRIPGAPAGLKLVSALSISENGSVVVLSNRGLMLLKPQP
ncbi:hypothetical protein [Caballeronia grimmiae]|uniref:hypothetical protein n=1 Tax=Caballeronia grimmiae TaxID=1071679 RepID=UPI0038BA6EFB